MRMRIISFCVLLPLLAPYGAAQRNDTLVLHIVNFVSRAGNVEVTAYKNDASFLSDTSFFLDRTVPLDNSVKNGACDVTVVLPHGEYAFVVFQDLNANGKLDVNFFGYPKEPFAFSRPFHPTFRAPKFREISFQCRSFRDTLVIPLMK
jgi:uncharacterized protein (DUF2141 family)